MLMNNVRQFRYLFKRRLLVVEKTEWASPCSWLSWLPGGELPDVPKEMVGEILKHGEWLRRIQNSVNTIGTGRMNSENRFVSFQSWPGSIYMCLNDRRRIHVLVTCLSYVRIKTGTNRHQIPDYALLCHYIFLPGQWIMKRNYLKKKIDQAGKYWLRK